MNTRIRVLLGLMVLLATLAIPTATDASTRRTTGQGHTLTFQAGDTVVGDTITESNGLTWNIADVSCILHATMSGRVTTGVINPFKNSAETAHRVACTTANSSPGPRIQSGPTWLSFTISPRHPNVAGSIIEDLVSHLVWYDCRMDAFPHDGRVFNGVVNPTKAETTKQKLQNCRDQTPSPGLRVQSGQNWLSFSPSPNPPNVVGVAIETGGNTFLGCLQLHITTSGRVFVGVVNPDNNEVKAATKCDTDLKSGHFIVGTKQSTKDSPNAVNDSLTFGSGVGVMGAYITLSTGEKYVNCYIWQTDNHSGGTVYGGLVSFWTGDNAGLPGCGSPGTVVS